VTITVFGLPGPQGSKKLVGRDRKGRGILIESSAKVKPWREAVKWAVLEYRRAHGSCCIEGPVRMEVTFTLPMPKSTKRESPSTRPDLSKLVRSTEDALTEVGIWEDDGRVVECISRKVYPGYHSLSLESPGARIHLEPY
jgi:crossover junction endodeoxyribonuclease RusA